jgi:hypothetical protein
MASVTQRNDKVEGLWSDCVVRKLRKTVAITVAFRHLLSKPTKIAVVLPLHRVAGSTEAERERFLASALAVKRPLYSGFKVLIFNARQSHTDVRNDPTPFPRLRAAFLERNLFVRASPPTSNSKPHVAA